MAGCLCRGHKHLDRGSGAGDGGCGKGGTDVNVWVRMRTTASEVSVGRCARLCDCEP